MSSRPLSRIRKTITFRLILWYSAFFVVSTSFLFLLAYFLLSSSVRTKDRQETHEKLDEYAAQYRAGGIEALKHEVALEERSAKDEAFFVQLTGSDGSELFLSNPDRWKDFDLKKIASTAGEPITLRNYRGTQTVDIESLVLSDGAVLRVGQSAEQREALLETFREVFVAFMIPAVVLGIAGGAFLASRTLRPVRGLIQTIRSVSTGQIEARVPTSHTGDELDELVLLFNSMPEKIETLITGMRHSLDSVAHDLRTPLTRLRGTAEMALQSEQNPESAREALADCVEEADRILTMLNTLMDISEAETGAMKLQLTEVSVSELLADTVNLYAHVAEEKKLTLNLDSAEDLFLTGDLNRLRQVMANLLDNAIKYTPSGGRVELAAFARNHDAVIVVKDTGIGIAPEDKPKIWNRLYRADHSYSQKGLGLGLSLVKAVVQAHQGRIDVASKPGGGSEFTLSFPSS